MLNPVQHDLADVVFAGLEPTRSGRGGFHGLRGFKSMSLRVILAKPKVYREVVKTKVQETRVKGQVSIVKR